MTKALRRIRGMLGMGLTWALGWAIVGGGIMEGIVDPGGRILDMWPQTLAIPGFLGGVAFSLILAVAERRRRFDELSLPRFAAWGAAAGALLGVVALSAGAASAVAPLVLRGAMIIAPVALLCAASASGTLALARTAARRESLDGADGTGARLAGVDAAASSPEPE